VIVSQLASRCRRIPSCHAAVAAAALSSTPADLGAVHITHRKVVAMVCPSVNSVGHINTSIPVNTDTGDHLKAQPLYTTSHQGQLSFLSSVVLSALFGQEG